VLTSSWTGVPNKVAGECIYIYKLHIGPLGVPNKVAGECIYIYKLHIGPLKELFTQKSSAPLSRQVCGRCEKYIH